MKKYLKHVWFNNLIAMNNNDIINQIKNIRHLNLSKSQQMSAFMMIMDPNDRTIPTIKTPEWVEQLGKDLHNLVKNEKINEYLLGRKTSLLERRIRKFNENNWFEWGAPRNIHIMKEHANKECIYIYNLTRNTNVAFVGKVNYFGGALLMLKPKKKYNLNKVVSYLNSNVFKDNFMFSNRFKIGHRQISNSFIYI